MTVLVTAGTSILQDVISSQKDNRQNTPNTSSTGTACQTCNIPSCYIRGHIMGQRPIMPCPSNWGWVCDIRGCWQPLWTVLLEAAKSYFELIHYGCPKGYNRQCKCVKAGLPYTTLCACGGQGQVD